MVGLRQEDDEVKASLGSWVRSDGPQCDTAAIVAESLNELVSRRGSGETNQRS